MLKRFTVIFSAVAITIGTAWLISSAGKPRLHPRVNLQNLQRQSQDLEGDPDAATKYFLEMRLPQGATALDTAWYRAAIDAANRMTTFSSAIGSTNPTISAAPGAALATWNELGPSNVGGRTRAILIHP